MDPIWLATKLGQKFASVLDKTGLAEVHPRLV